MDDLTLTKKCAEAMGFDFRIAPGDYTTTPLNLKKDVALFDKLGKVETIGYDPLHDDAQAMALVKRFRLRIGQSMVAGVSEPEHEWAVERTSHDYATSKDLNRAICECCAKLWLSKEKASDAKNQNSAKK